MRVTEVAHLIEASLISHSIDYDIQHLSIDSRSSKNINSELFIALKGPNHDGHSFIPDLIKRGCRNFIVEDEVEHSAECNILKVTSSIDALQCIAASRRKAFKGAVIGITGSNGKTIVKEWLSTILSSRFNVIKSPKSYNSQVGVPLSIWPINQLHEVGVFEAGISKPDEMAKLEPIISPTVGILTNIGTAHDESFESKDQKIVEKLTLFKNSKSLIFRTDVKGFSELVRKHFQGEDISWSFKEGAKYKVNLYKKNQLIVSTKDQSFSFQIKLTDNASLENITHSIIAAIHLGLSQEEIQKGLLQISPIKMRLELKKGGNNCYLIDDTYNNDFAGLQIALDFMDQQKHMVNKTLVLSDFVQSKLSHEFYKNLNDLLLQKGITRLIGIGHELQKYHEVFELPSSFYENTKDFISSNEIRQLHDELILIKGARQFGLEHVSKALVEKAHKTVLEISLDAITHNLNFYKSLLKPETKVMVVVKALAYGAGSIEISKMLEFHKVDYLAVAYADEGIALRKNGITLPIMVMNPSKDDLFNLMQFGLEPEIYSLEQLRLLIEFYKASNKRLPVHLILNTGMNRLGFNDEDIDELLHIITNTNNVLVKSIFTHLAASEEEKEEKFTRDQIEAFRQQASKIELALPNKPIRHILNSGGIVRHNQFQEGMVRLGIGLHGIEVSGLQSDRLLKPAVLKTVISQIRTVKKGETIGYGRKGVAKTHMQIATIAIGYADGYLRYFGNGRAYVTVNGSKAPTIGNICMDMSMIDISGLNVSVGDEVIIFGNNPSINQLAEWADTIPYEILTNVSSRVSRVFYSG